MIYSGGDDVLAFLPLDQALGYAQAIHDEFDQRIAALTSELRTDDGVTLHDPPSLSVGIAIGHYAENLNRLLEWARDTESYAKGGEEDVFTGRNALAVAYYPRGAGEPSARVGHPWPDDPVRSRWARWVRYHRHDLLPDGAGYEIRRLAREFAPLKNDDVLAVLNLELSRILKRKQSGHGGDPGLLAEVYDVIVAAAGTSRAELLRLASELIVSREIASALNVAVGPPPSLAIETRWFNAAGFAERTLRND